MTAEAILDRLEKVHPRGNGKYHALCPAHPDKNPSLSIRVAGTILLVKCWAGCQTSEIVAAIGLTMADLFTNNPIALGPQPIPSRQRLDLDDVTFRFELGALDRRVRAAQILKAVATFSADEMKDEERDRLMKAVARAHADMDRAAFLETVADDLRMKAYQERKSPHAP